MTISIRPWRDEDDTIEVWRLRNLPESRLMSCDPKRIGLREHAEYMGEIVDYTSDLQMNPIRRRDRYLIADDRGFICGFACVGAQREVSLVVASCFRKHGVGTQLLNAAKKKLKARRAIIRSDNYPSQMLFAKCGFKKKEDDGALQTWVR